MAIVKSFERYGSKWHGSTNPIDIEIFAIQKGGKWKSKDGKECGNGLFFHYKSLQSLLWPHKKWHRWNELLLESFCDNRIIAVLGPASSGKTREAADYALTTYICFPKCTSVLISSTDMRSLELRVWGEIKKNWVMAKQVYPATPGNMVGSKMTITTDSVDDMARDFRNGIIGIPCMVGGSFVGLGKYVGIKNSRVILLADELQFLNKTFCDSIANLNKNEWFKCLGLGNPKERMDALGILSEPSDSYGGWDSVDETEKTKTWPTRMDGGICVQLVGTDSPNFDVPESDPIPFPFLISRKSIASDIQFYGRDSLQFSMMNLGMMPKDSVSRRVITRALCNQFHAMDDPIWQGGTIKKILGLDAAYGNVGGDRCMATELWLGRDTRGKQIIATKPSFIVPVSVKSDKIPEDQIVDFSKQYCESNGIPPEHLGFDSTGKGSLGTSFARIWSNSVNPIEFGGKPTERPVGNDPKVTCRDYYSKFVTELWMAIRYAIEADQFRGMTESLLSEGSMREWTIVSGNRVEIETKAKTKERMGRSPDEFDSLVCAVEMARRLGFVIDKFSTASEQEDKGSWFYDMRRKNKDLNKRNTLVSI